MMVRALLTLLLVALVVFGGIFLGAGLLLAVTTLAGV